MKIYTHKFFVITWKCNNKIIIKVRILCPGVCCACLSLMLNLEVNNIENEKMCYCYILILPDKINSKCIPSPICGAG